MSGRWQPFVKADSITGGIWTDEQIDKTAAQFGFPREEVVRAIEKAGEAEIWVNNLYQVSIFRGRDIVHLSIKRLDKGPSRDWRHFQRIKNELVGPENEGVELYPAESRLVDTANQYHMWVLADPKARVAIGFNSGRHAYEDTHDTGAVQRPFDQEEP